MNCLSVAIQAGGGSKRMGVNKALMSFLGEPLITRISRLLSPVSDDLFIITQETEAYQHLGLRTISDEVPNMGAIGGLLTAMAQARCDYVAVVACDMPFVSPGILKHCLEILVDNNADVAIPLTMEGYEPLHAVYRKATCLPAIREAMAAGKKRLISWFSDVKVMGITEDRLSILDPDQLAFINTNTIDDFLQAVEIAKQHPEMLPPNFD
ncbi:hypothetical protein ADN00_15415 [Ornatilinea apprima]|uniref:Probable molybdenum cofactor guanylyltransferase n=1 Tax=Ornatilinea apprima TaxID=1134406 RepID=A0A0P6XKT2_9CHLR|nr:molybdenum cofactor guanylyltransferase [Ornatilinea apprima]KPL72212.1 hypothetical protein ADN00_15415 [Ornatilinea apprima]